MGDLFTIENLVNLVMLVFLQAVLGFDNLLYISIESKRAPLELQSSVRKKGILLAIALRIALLFGIVGLLDSFNKPFFHMHNAVIEGEFNFATVIFLFGGGFIMYTAVKEIHHMLQIDDLSTEERAAAPRSAGKVIAMIVLMNLIFSFDSILSAIAITRVMAVLAIAIISSGILMLVLADKVSVFLNKNKKYEVLGLFILLIVGVVLLGEGGHEAHLKLFGFAVEPMSKTTFYFSIAVLVVVDILQSGYERKLGRKRRLS